MIVNYPRFLSDLAKYGATHDAAVTEALAVTEQARAARHAAPIEDLRAQYANGEVTRDNARALIVEAAVLAAGAERIQAAAAEVEAAAAGTLRRWVGAHADKIVKELRPAFDKAAALVQVAGQHFPPGVSDRDLIAAGSKAVAANEGLAAALDTLNAIRTLRIDVADCAHESEQDVTWWINGARDMQHLAQAMWAYNGAGNAFHALAHAGFTLRMNTAAEAAKVAAGAQATTDAEEAAAREAELKEYRESWQGTPWAIAN